MNLLREYGLESNDSFLGAYFSRTYVDEAFVTFNRRVKSVSKTCRYFKLITSISSWRKARQRKCTWWTFAWRIMNVCRWTTIRDVISCEHTTSLSSNSRDYSRTNHDVHTFINDVIFLFLISSPLLQNHLGGQQMLAQRLYRPLEVACSRTLLWHWVSAPLILTTRWTLQWHSLNTTKNHRTIQMVYSPGCNALVKQAAAARGGLQKSYWRHDLLPAACRDDLSATTGGLGVLSAHADPPVVTDTTVWTVKHFVFTETGNGRERSLVFQM